MKKLLMTLVCAAALCGGAFARGDFGVFYYLDPVKTNTYRGENSPDGTYSTFNAPSYFGIGVGGDIYFGKPAAGFLDIGLGLECGMNLITKQTSKDFVNNKQVGDEKTWKFSGDNLAFLGLYFHAGPALNFNFGPKFALYVSPALNFEMLSANTILTVGSGSVKTDYLQYSIAADIGAAARLWVGTNFGFNFGINAIFPFAGALEATATTTTGSSKIKTKENYPQKDGFTLRAKVGVIWRFGY